MRHHALFAALIGTILLWPHPSHAHGRLWEPPGRSTMFRRGFNVPVNYNDHQLYCGGFQHQVKLGYKCGVCGDPWDGQKDNEAGGKYATGQISRAYHQGDNIAITVDLTVNHKGYFEFKICPVNDAKVRATHECMDRHQMTLADGSGSRYYITSEMGSRKINMTWVLPSDVTCTQCVLQWRYHAGNSWGKDLDTGRECVGCGYQEEFYGCADIQIVPPGQTLPMTLLDKQAAGRQHTGANSGNQEQIDWTGQDSNNTEIKKGVGISEILTRSGNGEISLETPNEISGSHASSTAAPSTSEASTMSSTGTTDGDSIVCQGVRADLDTWCQLNCQGGYCPPEYCTCERRQYVHSSPQPKGCRGAGIYADLPGYTTWCRQNCAMGFCPSFMCVC